MDSVKELGYTMSIIQVLLTTESGMKTRDTGKEILVLLIKTMCMMESGKEALSTGRAS